MAKEVEKQDNTQLKNLLRKKSKQQNTLKLKVFLLRMRSRH